MLESTNPACPYCNYVQKSYACAGPLRQREKRIALRIHLQDKHPEDWERLHRILKEERI